MPNIMIVGEFPGKEEAQNARPQDDASYQILNQMFRVAGINRDECYFTNVFQQRPPQGRLENFGGPKVEAVQGWPQLSSKLWIHRNFQPEIDRLLHEVDTIKPNVILALGVTALWALCKQTGIKKNRGTPMRMFDGECKVLPTYHPSIIFRQWKLRPIVIKDIAKLRAESLFPEVRRPVRYIHMSPTIPDLYSFYERYMKDAGDISTDIETKMGTVTEIGFAPTHDRALVVPFYSRDTPGGNYWATAEEEFAAWQFVKMVCEKHPMVGQNFCYDLQYLWMKNRIRTMTVADDTMILHHALFPEMEKSLGFLGSIYTNEPSWKFMRTDHDTLKAEDD